MNKGVTMRIGILTAVLLLSGGMFLSAFGEKSIAVMNLRSEELRPTDCIAVTNYLTTELQKIKGYRILAWDDVTNMLEHQAGKQALGCEDDECLAEIGGALGVDYILAGDIGSIGDRFLMNLKLININRAATERRASTIVEGNIGLLMDRLPAMVGEILEIETQQKIPEVVIDQTLELSKEPNSMQLTPIDQPETREGRVRFSLGAGFNFSQGWYHFADYTNTIQSYGFSVSPGLKFSRSRLNLELTIVGGENVMDGYIEVPTHTFTAGGGLVWYLETWRIADIITIAPGLGAGFWYTEDEIAEKIGRINDTHYLKTYQFGALYLRVKIGRDTNCLFFDVGQIVGTDAEVGSKERLLYRVPPIMQLRAGYERTF